MIQPLFYFLLILGLGSMSYAVIHQRYRLLFWTLGALLAVFLLMGLVGLRFL